MIITKHYKMITVENPNETGLYWVEVTGAKDSARLRQWIRAMYRLEADTFLLTIKESING